MERTVIPSLTVQARPQYIPLSFSQEHLWFIDRLEGSVQYHIPFVIRLKGNLNQDALEYALKAITNRHEVLRTVIMEKDGAAHQYVMPDDELRLSFINGLVYNEDGRWLQKTITELIDQPFDLSKDHMLRATLITIGSGEYMLVLTAHHIASDKWSIAIIVKELAVLYNAYKVGGTSQLATLSTQYADYSIWQRDYIQGTILDGMLKYWKGNLHQLTPLQLPADYKSPPLQSIQGASICFGIDESLSQQLKQLGQQQRVSLFTILLTSFTILLQKYSGQQDICVGTTIAGRQQLELQNLVGFFENTLALRTEVCGNHTFTELLQKVKDATAMAYAHQAAPFEKVVDAVVAVRNIDRNPLHQVMFLFNDTPELPNLSFSEMELSFEKFEHVQTLFDLTLTITDIGDCITGSMVYNTNLYSSETINLMISHFSELLKSIIKQPDQKIGLLSMLDTAEEKRLVFDFNDTHATYPNDKSLVDLFQEQAEKKPSNIAVVFEQQELTYKELNERANQVAHYLKGKGVKENALVPICLERSINMIIGLLGILKSGGVFIPVDPEYPLERIKYMLEDCGAKLIISNKASRLKLKTVENLDIIEIDNDEIFLNTQPVTNLTEPIKPDQSAYVIYTSGSTGKPKGVVVLHSSLVNLLTSIVNQVDFKQDSRFLSVTTFSFDICYLEFYMPLITGGKLILVPREVAVDGFQLSDNIANYLPTHMQGTPSTWQLLLDSGWENREQIKILIGGEAVKEAIKEQLTRLGTVFNLYGPTETTIWSSIKKLALNEKVLIGKPIANTTIFILNDHQQLCTPKVAGEICIGGAGLAKGYLNRAELTNEKFIANPFNKDVGARLYKTGDLGRWLPDGNIEYLGRIDNQVKVNGYRIELGEIETVLHQSKMVHQAVVVARENKEGGKRLVSYYVPDWKEVKLKESELYQRQIASWKEVYETEYATEVAVNEDEEFDINIWKDSFTGKPIPPEQMREWLDEIIEIIMREEPGHVLQIGSGTGLIYYQLAGKIKKYIGTDISSSSIKQINQRIGKKSRDYGPTELHVCAAHEISLGEDEVVDTIILNSVSQHFPGENYMNTVISNGIGLLKGEGRIIIGDVRDNRFLELFKLRLDLQKLSASVSANELMWLAEKELLKEEELCFSPEYFYKLPSLFKEITHVEITCKKGYHVNELSKYRYNVVIQVGGNKVMFEPPWQVWNGFSQKQFIIEQLQKAEPLVAIKKAPNPKLSEEKLLSNALKDKIAGTVGELKKIIVKKDEEGSEINEILTVAREAGYQLILLPDEDPFKINILLELEPSLKYIKPVFSENGHSNNTLFTNIPLFGDIVSLMQKDIRQSLKQILPDYMVPSDFIAIAKLPLTNNGKIDRKFLSEREDKTVVNNLNYEAPHTAIEQTLVNTWQQVLDVESVGVHDDFFELGGHSLLATRLVSAINKALEIELKMNDLFLHPSVGSLAQHISKQTNKLSPNANDFGSLLQIKSGIRKIPLYMVCGGGGTVFKFKEFADMLDVNQPVYGLQQPIEIKNLKEFPDTIEGIAEKYIEEILLQNPGGPYALSGHCLGGIIAFEMAKQMEALGKEVKLLAMFDTVIGEKVKQEQPSFKNFYHIPVTLKKYTSNLFLRLQFQTFLLSKHSKYSIDNKVNRIKSLISAEDQFNSQDTALKVFKKLEQKFLKAYKNYQITHYDKDIVAFYAKEHYYFWDKDNNVRFKRFTLNDQTKDLWKKYVRSITMYEVEGEHSTIFYPNNATEFAQLLQQHLNRCNDV